MNKLIQLGLIVVGVSAVAIADVFVKKVFSPRTGFFTDIKNPLMLAIVALYLLQIIIFAYIFDRKAQLGVVGILQTALYALIVIGSGVLFFQEGFSARQIVGMVLAFVGVILMTL